jgi:putative addiction module component (TIGR02574 family)
MNHRVRTIVEEARKLTPEERRELFDVLEVEFASEASDGTPEEIEAAWRDEVERRIAAAERGETTFVEAEEVLARMRQLIR